MIYGEGNTVPVPKLDLLTFLFGETILDPRIQLLQPLDRSPR